MTDRRGSWLERPLVRTAAVLAVLAYLPALTASPGRMPSDSKLYLYLDPGRFFGDAASTFDGRQFAGWVPHQHVAYLWPSTPWFWLFDTLGVPEWIAHRLWIGTILLAAGLGVRWCTRLLGLGALAAFTAAIVYQLSLYVLPYVSRTSVMLLPWAGLGWVVAFTIRASRRHTWGDPAAVALVVLTVGAVNATALAMIVPAPVLWLIHVRWQGSITTRQGVLVAVRVGVLSLAVSLWWITMLVIQGRFGTDVLPYSESLADVSLTATSTETWRSLGYWLFYVRDPYAATTTESLRYLASSSSIVVSYLVPLLALAALTWVGWIHRRFVALLIATGLLLAVGVHPISERSPLMGLLAGDDDAGLALALRSSTRALPVMMLGVALAIAMAVQAGAPWRLPRLGWPGHHVLAGVAVVVAIVNLPSIWNGAFVDPALVRDQDPPDAWIAAAEALDTTGAAGRVLQLPGAEFGAYRWGYTVDQPLPGLTDKPLVTRDLLPLGSAGAMDLLYALDDRAQDGVLEPGSIAPVARLLGVDTVWLTNDIAFDRFRTARPEVVRDIVIDAPGMGTPESFGELFLNRPDIAVTDERGVGDPRVGEPITPVELVPVADPGHIIRTTDRTLVVSGSGDGLVDAAAAGLLDASTSVIYSADLDGGGPEGSLGLLVTDSNRDRARHWRSSQDTTGFTEPGGPAQGVLRPVAADARLELFDTTDPSTQTVAVQRGPVIATATSYGEPFAYLPEHRPFAAIDGRDDTAWIVGEHGDPIGEMIHLEWSEPADQLTVLQPWRPGDRRIGSITLVEDTDGVPSARRIELDDRSVTAPGQVIPLQFTDGGSVDIVIEGVIGGTPFTGSVVAGVGFSDIDLGLGASSEITRPPHDALASIEPGQPLALAFTRLRTDPMDRWRDDPEFAITREFDLPDQRDVEISTTLRVDARATDADLAAAFGWPAVASSRLTGSPRHSGVAAIDGDPATTWITAFDEAVGATLSITGVTVPIETIEVRQPVAGFSSVTSVTLRSGGNERVVELAPNAAGGATGMVSPPLPPGDLDVVLSGVDVAVTIDRRYGDPVGLPAAISEVVVAGLPAATGVADADVTFPCVPVVDIDGASLAATIEVSGSAWLDGAELTTTMCDPDVALAAGPNVVTTASDLPPFLQLDRVVLDGGLRSVLDAPADSTVTVVASSRFERTVEISGCRAGCWLVLGEGFNEAWEASGESGSLGAPRQIDGGFNGWWIEPPDDVVRVVIGWSAQTPLTLALVASSIAAVVAIGLIVWDRRRTAPPIGGSTDGPRPVDATGTRLTARHSVAIAVAWAVFAALLIGPIWALWGVVAGSAVVVSRRARLAELTALMTLLAVAAAVTIRERRLAPPPGGGWPATFESLHGLGMFAMVAVLVAGCFADDSTPSVRPDIEPDIMTDIEPDGGADR